MCMRPITPQIIQIREIFLTVRHLALVVEFANEGDLSEVVGRHVAREVRGILSALGWAALCCNAMMGWAGAGLS